MSELEKKCHGNPKWYPKKDDCFFYNHYKKIECEYLFLSRACTNIKTHETKIKVSGDISRIYESLIECYDRKNNYQGVQSWCLPSLKGNVACESLSEKHKCKFNE